MDGPPEETVSRRGPVLVLAPLAVGLSLVLWLPAGLIGFSKNGHPLSVNQRDLRVFNNFTDPRANANVRGFADFPGALGAELALWKGAAEWNSEPRLDSGDIFQPQIGDGGANFDAFWQGRADSVGGVQNNIISTISSCAQGLLAFTEAPMSNGWRIRFCDNRLWDDGPGAIVVTTFDIQSVMAHEYGHALGLGHSTVNAATMFPSTLVGTENKRSIHSDDIAGLQCIYGGLSGSRPRITDVTVDTNMGTVTIVGSGFDIGPTNEVWFTNRTVTVPTGNPRVVVSNLASVGGTSITLTIPRAAGAGEIMVKKDGQSNTDLSNAYPTDLGEPFFGASSFYNGLGGNPTCVQSLTLPQLGEPFDLQVDASGHPGGAGFTGVWIYAASSSGVILAAGELLVNLGSPQYGFLIAPSNGGLDLHRIVIPANPALLGAQATAQGFTYSLSQWVLCNAERFTLGAAF